MLNQKGISLQEEGRLPEAEVFFRRAIAVSDYAKRGMDRAFFGLFSKKLVVVPHGVEQIFQDFSFANSYWLQWSQLF